MKSNMSGKILLCFFS